MAHGAFRMKLKFLASPLGLFRTSHGAAKGTNMELPLSASGALGHGPVWPCPSLRAPPLQTLPGATLSSPVHLGLLVVRVLPPGKATLSFRNVLTACSPEAARMSPDCDVRRVAWVLRG